MRSRLKAALAVTLLLWLGGALTAAGSWTAQALPCADCEPGEGDLPPQIRSLRRASPYRAPPTRSSRTATPG